MTTNNLNFLKINGIEPRPGAGKGLWALFLLPLSLITSAIQHPIILTPTYKLTSICCTGFMISSLVIIYKECKNQRLSSINVGNIVAVIITALTIHNYLQKDWFFSLRNSVLVTLLYTKVYLYIMQHFKQCFTLGEAGIASQAVVILLQAFFVNISGYLIKGQEMFMTNMQISNIIIQLGLLGIGTIAWVIYKFNVRQIKTLAILSVLLIFLIILIPLHVLLGRSPLLWIMQLLFEGGSTVKLTCYWSFCCITAAFAVNKQIKFAKKASTGTRKIFHILAVFIYIPGLLYKCSLLYLASGVVTGLFFALEILRILQVPPLGQHLQEGFVVFSDEKDIGNIALTPIYLLISCSLPLWIHPSPCDITDSAIFGITPLLSGLLAIGIGDTAASVIGSRYGRTQWPGSKKTIEGTVGCILSQIGFIHSLIYFDIIHKLTNDYLLRVYISIVLTSIVEARTTQVDNLVLPFIMYILLI